MATPINKRDLALKVSACAAALGAASYLSILAVQRSGDAGGAALASWSNIGGCGGGGGGAAAGAGKWIGRSVSGGLLDVEVMNNTTIGGDYRYDATNVTMTKHYLSHPSITTGVSLPWKSNVFEYQGYSAANSGDVQGRVDRVTGGLGDLGLSFNKNFGNENEHSLGLSLGLPTGQANIKRLYLKDPTGAHDDVRWLNPYVQPGSGLLNLGLSYEFTKDKDWGLIIWGASYSAAFAADNNGCKDPTDIEAAIDKCQKESPWPLTYKVWEYKHQDWGSHDNINWRTSYGTPATGATGADNVSVYAHVGRKEEHSTQSMGLTLSVPLSPTYYFDYGTGALGSNRVGKTVESYSPSLKWSMGLEITHPSFPVFIAVGVPWDIWKLAKSGELEPQNYVGSIGIRGTFF